MVTTRDGEEEKEEEEDVRCRTAQTERQGHGRHDQPYARFVALGLPKQRAPSGPPKRPKQTRRRVAGIDQRPDLPVERGDAPQGRRGLPLELAFHLDIRTYCSPHDAEVVEGHREVSHSLGNIVDVFWAVFSGG
ncbi:hypothetical protein PG984_007089 [Apiospora sp. TS-2023a]